MSTHITGKCPHCKSEYRLRAHAAGRRAKCKGCSQVFIVPGQPVGKTVDDDVVSWLNGGGKAEPDDDEEEEPDAPTESNATSPEGRNR